MLIAGVSRDLQRQRKGKEFVMGLAAERHCGALWEQVGWLLPRQRPLKEECTVQTLLLGINA